MTHRNSWSWQRLQKRGKKHRSSGTSSNSQMSATAPNCLDSIDWVLKPQWGQVDKETVFMPHMMVSGCQLGSESEPVVSNGTPQWQRVKTRARSLRLQATRQGSGLSAEMRLRLCGVELVVELLLFKLSSLSIIQQIDDQYYWRSQDMDPVGQLDVQPRPRRPNARNSFAPSQSSADNEFFNSRYDGTSEQISSYQPQGASWNSNQAQRPKQNTSQVKSPQAKAKGGQPNPNPPQKMDVIEEQGDERRRGRDNKRKNRFNSFEPSSPQPQEKPPSPKKKPPPPEPQPKQKVEPQPKPAPKKPAKPVQQVKAKEIKKKEDQLNVSIKDLKKNYQQLKEKEKELTGRKSNNEKGRVHSPFGAVMSADKEKEVQEFLYMKQKEERRRRRKLKRIEDKQMRKKEKKWKIEDQMKEKEQRMKLKQLKQLSDFKQKHVRMMQSELGKEELVAQFLTKFKDVEGYHIRKQREAEMTKKKELRDQKKVLSQRRDHFKPLDVSEFEEHQKWYQDKRYDLDREKQEARDEQQQRIAEENQNMNEFYRGPSHGGVEDEYAELRRKKREPKEKARKMKVYREHVKNNFKPRAYHSHTIEHKPMKREDSRMSHRQVKRYKFYKGQAVGEIMQTLPVPKKHSEVQRMGEDYLDYVRSLPKRKDAEEEVFELDPSDIDMLERKFNSVGRVKKSVAPIYDDDRKKKTKVEVRKDMKRDELNMVVLQLRAVDDKLKRGQRLLNNQQHGNVNNVQGVQRNLNEGMVENIERKLNLLAQL